MNRAKKTISVLLVAELILAAFPAWLGATSAVPEPGAFGIPINPNASGTKLSGPMSVVYDIVVDNSCDSLRRVLNVFVVTTLQTGNAIRPFNRALDPASGFCFGENTSGQLQLVTGLITEEAMPFFFGSQIGSCVDTVGMRPCWEVKSITNFLSSGEGALSLDITLAVH